ncbi:talin-B-like [Planococcus citri]|uniref:talin-B-like n=1 Tax=Planococcus citri TaxID=170843 RepID=UPI0031F8DDF5
MPEVTEMLCIFCLRSVTTTSPVFAEDDRIQEYIAISRCGHLMHMSCFVFAHPTDRVTCRQPKCGKVLDHNQVLAIDSILKDRMVETSDEKCNDRLDDELTTGPNLATTTSNLELTTSLKLAKDKIAELEASANHHAELMVEAEKRTREAKAAELEAKKRQYAAEDRIAQLEANAKCNAELLVKANKHVSETKAAELKATKRYYAAKDKIVKLEAKVKLKAQLVAKADKCTSEAKAAELEAKKRYDAAKDKIAQLEADAKQNAELLAEANECASEAKAAELEAKKRYDAAQDKIAQLEATAKQNTELLAEANTRASETKAAELEVKKRYDAADDKIAQLEAEAKKSAELLAEACKHTSEAKAAELDAKHYSELVLDAINKRASEAKEAELKAKKHYNTAKDSIAQLEAKAKHNSDLVAEANKRTSKAKAAELDAKKRYRLVLGMLSNQLIACRCTFSSDFSVLVSKEYCTGVPILPPNELSPPAPTSPIAPISAGSNNVLQLDQTPEVVRADSPNRECLTMESIADFPNALADYTPMSPTDGDDTFLLFSESIERSKVATGTSMKLPSHRVKDPRSPQLKSAAMENPISESMLSDNNTNHSPQTTSSESSIADKAPASRHSRSANTSTSSYRRKMRAQILPREDRSPAAKRWKGASESSTRREYEKYWQRFHITPPKLNPFFPVNSFPMGYTVADIQDTEKVGKVAILAYDVCLLGDGHSLGIANYVVKNKPIKDQLCESLYRRDLGIVDLITTLNRFTALPERIILSIGSWDATQNMQCSKFLAHFKDLLQIFEKCQVKVLYILPIITYPGMDVNRKSIDKSLSTDWGKTFGGQYELLSEMVSGAIDVQLPVIDDKGPMYEVDEYSSLVAAIRDRFIPVAITLPDENKEAEAP